MNACTHERARMWVIVYAQAFVCTYIYVCMPINSLLRGVCLCRLFGSDCLKRIYDTVSIVIDHEILVDMRMIVSIYRKT